MPPFHLAHVPASWPHARFPLNEGPPAPGSPVLKLLSPPWNQPSLPLPPPTLTTFSTTHLLLRKCLSKVLLSSPGMATIWDATRTPRPTSTAPLRAPRSARHVHLPGNSVSLPRSDIALQHQAHALGALLRETYLTGSGDTKIPTISTELANLKQVHVRVKIGSEGTAVFDSATALLQGLFPPTPKNREQLADGTVIVAPLGGYQYIPGMC